MAGDFPASSVMHSDVFKGKVVFVTGGGSGINLGIAKAFAELGANVGICGRTASKLESAARELEELGATVSCVPADVRDYAALETALQACADTCGGPVDTVVAGAAGNFMCPADRMSSNAFKTVIDIDLVGAFNTSRASLDQLRETRGDIQFVSAGQAWNPCHAQAHAAAAKAGIEAVMRNLALEWGPYGVRANSIVPGPVAATEGMDRLVGEEKHTEFASCIPLGSYVTLQAMGHASLFLASPLARFITGTSLIVDGGQNLGGFSDMTRVLAGGQPKAA